MDAGNYIYFFLLNGGDYPEFIVDSWLAPGMTTEELESLTAPLLSKWTDLGFSVNAGFHEYDSFLGAYDASFPQDAVGKNTSRAASRLVQR